MVWLFLLRTPEACEAKLRELLNQLAGVKLSIQNNEEQANLNRGLTISDRIARGSGSLRGHAQEEYARDKERLDALYQLERQIIRDIERIKGRLNNLKALSKLKKK